MSLMRGALPEVDGRKFEIVRNNGTAIQIKFMIEKNI